MFSTIGVELSAPGSYEFRLFRNGTKVATSGTFTVSVVSLTASPTAANPGQSVSAAWSGLVPSGNDWISLHPAGGPDTNYAAFEVVSGASGSIGFAAPGMAGTYEFRLFRNGARVATSNTFTGR